MANKILLYLKNFDWLLFFPAILLSAFGIIEIYSIALGQETVDLVNFHQQLLFVGLGIGIVFVLSFLDYRIIRDFGNYLYLLGIILLIVVLFFGSTIRGTTGWFSIGGLGVQPVEFIKIILIIFLARFFSFKQSRIKPFKYLLASGSGAFIFIILVFLQPDFGSSIILFAIWFFMLAIAGFKRKYFFIIGLVALVLFAGLWTLSFKDYQKQRVLTFLNTSSEPLHQGYNVSQAIIAVGAGGLTGRGIGFGSQSQLKFLPEAHNDFIFAVIAEELGFLGVFLVIGFFFIFFYRCISRVKNINNDFGIYFILGATGLIFIEMFINIGMNIGLLPVVGISLPYVSYGGSGIISKYILLGIVQNIIIKSKLNY